MNVEQQGMITQQLRSRGIVDERVIEAMSRLPRERFVPPELQAAAYHDGALPIGYGQTISQPVMVAILLEAMELRGTERVLDVGTGSGYQAALLGMLARAVYSIEIVPELAERARSVIQDLGIENVVVVEGDGSIGYPQAAPYDAIVVAAAAPEVPQSLVQQLADGGRLLVPIGPVARSQVLRRVRRQGDELIHEDLGGCIFVPLIGEEGYSA